MAALLATGAALGLPLAASAHALAQSSVPADGATVAEAPKQVVITFGQTPDPRLSTIEVVDTSGTAYDAGPTHAVPGNALQLQVALKPLPRGVYTVTWETVSTVDGHRASGAFAFGVGETPTADAAARARASAASPPPSTLAIAGRVMLFVGLLLMVGVASTSLLALEEVPAFAPLLLLAGWVVATLGAFGVIEAERQAARTSWSTLFSTSLGVTVAWRIAAVAASGLAVAAVLLVRSRASARRVAVAVAGLAAAGGMWVDVAASHAGAEAPVPVSLLLQWVHIVAAGVWIGGLFVLLLGIRGAPSPIKARAVRRFSAMALLAVVVLAATGTVRAVLEIASWHQLVASPFGQLVLVKVGLLVLLVALGAVNRYGSVPRATSTLRPLRRIASAEVMAGVAALLVAAALVNNSPPVEAASGGAGAPQQAAAVVVNGSDYATTVKVRLQVMPGTAGFNTFTAFVTDYDTGRPITTDQVTLQFSMPLRPDIGPSSLTLKSQRDGSYRARGGNLSVSGTWSVTALVQGATRAAEVHLQLATTVVPAPVVTVQRFSGSPTLYTIQLTKGRSIQVYLDPDKAGANEFHVTFIDPATQSGEVSITSAAAGMTAPGGTLQVLTLRRLDPTGHFVADVQVTKGESRYDILATAASGEQFNTFIEIAPGG